MSTINSILGKDNFSHVISFCFVLILLPSRHSISGLFIVLILYSIVNFTHVIVTLHFIKIIGISDLFQVMISYFIS